MAQNFCDVKWGFVIGSKCFTPQPKASGGLLLQCQPFMNAQ